METVLTPDTGLADLKSMIEENGATFSTSVTDELTHLVTTDRDVEKESTKCECAKYDDTVTFCLMNQLDKQASAVADCQIVSLDWLIKSAEKKKPLPEGQYVLGQGAALQAKPSPEPDTKTNGSGTDKKPETKKRSAVKDEPAEEPNKKLKDIQKASSKFLNVPVDEGFNENWGGFTRELRWQHVLKIRD
jgi:poly [ADP-ribose] polymerase